MALPRDRLTVCEQVYHRPADDEPQQFSSAFSRELEISEQAYRRNGVATDDWQPLDYGWLKSVGMLVVHNREGEHLQINPTPEEKAAIAKRVLMVAWILNDTCRGWWLIPPGESMRGYPDCADAAATLCVRARHQQARYTLFAVPR